MSPNFYEITISQEQEGQRLDIVLALFFPKLSLRKRRLLWEEWLVFVENKPRSAGFRVRAGQIVKILSKNIQSDKLRDAKKATSSYLQPHIIHEDENFIFVFKPQALHSTHLASGGPSLEANLAHFLPNKNKDAQLCNRLDAQTSGIVVLGKSEQALQEWLHLENYAKCEKRYVAMVQESEQNKVKTCIIKAALDTDKRKKSRVLPENVHSLRHTHFVKLAPVDSASYTALLKYFPSFPQTMPRGLFFMGCTIFKGARHQIRAHAAHAGFALFNDQRYIDANPNYKNESFLLHHGALVLPHERIYCPAPWQEDLSAELQKSITTFLLQNP